MPVHRLSMMDRFAILQVLPEQDNYMNLKVLHELRMKLSPTEAEQKEFEMVQLENGIVRMNPVKAVEERDMEFGERAEDLIAINLKRVNRESKLTEQHIRVYEKFVTKEDR